MKIKNTLLRIISLVIVIVMLLPTNVYAVDPDKTNSDGSDSGHVGEADKEAGRIAASCGKTGWLIYVAKKPPKGADGKHHGKATVVGNKVVYARATSQSNADPSKYDRSYLGSRLKNEQGKTTTVSIYNDKGKLFPVAKWGTPFDGDQKSRVGAIRNEILNKDEKHYYNSNHNISNVEHIIKEYLGKSILDKYLADPNNHYLILEPCAMHSGYTFKNGTYTKIDDYVASAYGWGLFYQHYYEKGKNSQKYGDGHNGWCDNCCLPRSCYLDDDWPGLPAAPTSKQLGSAGWGSDSITYETLTSFVGLGMMAYKTNLQTTCNETVTVPHHPAGEANGEYSIVKTYVKHHSDGTYEFEKCTSKINSFQTVKVEGEKATTKKPSYRLVHYIVTTKNNYKKETDNEKNYPQDLLPESKTIDSKGKLIWSDSVEKTGTKVTIKDGKGNKLTNKVTYNSDEEVKSATINIKNLCKNADHGTVYLLLIADEDDLQTTCDEKKDEPHTPPDESKGDYIIVKNYVTKNGDTYKDDIHKYRENVTSKIIIEDEAKTTNPSYKLTNWIVTDSSDTKVDAIKDGKLVWKDRVPGVKMKSDTKPTDGKSGRASYIDMKTIKSDGRGKKAKTVYLLLIKEKDDIQTTCDEDKPTPHPAPNESKGTYKIVKNYVTKTDDTYTDDGCHIRTNVANKIKIEDEAKTTGYHLEAWKISTNKEGKKVTAVKDKKLVWEKNVPATVKKSGTTPKTVDLKEKGHEGNTVYLLLVRDKSKVQTTCDEPIPTPHPAPNESTGTYKIVKNYVTDSNGKYKDDGCFCKTKVTHQIKIEDESTTTGYTLVAWKATDSSTESVTSVASFIFFAFFRCANIM